MFRIGVCDDEEIICSEVEQIILKYSKRCVVKFDVEVFYSGEELCNIMKDGVEFDLVFLDIELRLINGIEVGKFIRDVLKNETIHIVYISAKDSYYLELFDVRPMHFLHKPLTSEKLIKDIEKAIELSNLLEYSFTFQQGHINHKKSIKDILYFEANGRMVKIVTSNGESYFYGSLKEVYKDLERHHFFFIHQSYLVNYSHVIEFGHKELTMSNKAKLPISRQKRDQVLDIFISYEKEGI